MARLIFFSAAWCLVFVPVALAKGPAYTNPDKADADFKVQGEYVGKIKTNNGELDIGVQVIALGKGKFRAVGYRGGLPGAGWDKSTKRETEGERNDGAVEFSGERTTTTIKRGQMTLARKDGEEFGTLEKTMRTSPTLGEKPPQGAVVLFDGTSADAFTGGKMTEERLLMAGCTSQQKFGDCSVHVEFRLPYMPEDTGQARGNSGIYLQGRYEVQMLDSFGLEGKNNECGGIYELQDPGVNMCLPPLAWQTYDIEFTAAKYDGEKAVSPPRITVRHNGVEIHKDVELPIDRGTRAAPVKPGPEPGPIYLQNHGDSVVYRNIWVLEKK